MTMLTGCRQTSGVGKRWKIGNYSAIAFFVAGSMCPIVVAVKDILTRRRGDTEGEKVSLTLAAALDPVFLRLFVSPCEAFWVVDLCWYHKLNR
jgi:hypothetical protein